MTAKELMLGDWVLMASSPVEEKKHTCIALVDILHIAQGKECEPIPLTPEILELNRIDGYKEDVNEMCRCYPNSMGEFFNFEYTYNGTMMLSMAFEYVHELQHALRLCVLNELADNFKVE